MKTFFSLLSLSRSLAMGLTACGLLVGCATGPNYAYDGEADDGSRADPAAYIVESFPVNRPRERRPASVGAEFYFKRCSESGEKWPYSRTSYDCDYPF